MCRYRDSNHHLSDFSHTKLDDDTGFLCTCFHPSLRTKWTASSSATQQKGLSNSFKRLKTLCGLQWPALTCGRWESWLYYSYAAGPVSQVRERESRWNGADLEAPSPAAVEMHPAEHVRHSARVRPSTCSGGVVRVSVPECMLSPMFIFLTQLESDWQSQSFVRKELRHIDCRCTPPFSPQYFSFCFFLHCNGQKEDNIFAIPCCRPHLAGVDNMLHLPAPSVLTRPPGRTCTSSPRSPWWRGIAMTTRSSPPSTTTSSKCGTPTRGSCYTS